jgi:lysozyme
LKTKLLKILSGLLLAVIIIVLLVIATAQDKVRQSEKYIYPDFGQNTPKHLGILGIDVSWYQGPIHWPSVLNTKHGQQSIQFVFLKATQGWSWLDPSYFLNCWNLRNTQLAVGLYHFYNQKQGPEAQAKWFCSMIQLKKGDLAPILDIEGNDPTDKKLLVKNLKKWLQIVENKLGIRPIIYTNAYFYKTNLAGSFEQYPLWVAQYEPKPIKPNIQRNWLFWQFSQTGTVNGIKAKVDLNVYNGTRRSFEALRIKNNP